MIFDYNVPIPVEEVCKKVQMERYQPFQNSLEARQFDHVMLRDNELKKLRDIYVKQFLCLLSHGVW